MPDLPTPQDAAEAALFSECWDVVLSYADLCTSGSAAATQLATEAFTHGIRESRASGSARKGIGRRTARLPRIPLLLTSVRTTAAAWEQYGQGHRLDPELRLWLNSEKAARYTGPPLHRPLALRGLRDMQEPDAALLWLTEVEALPLPAMARRLGLDPASAAEELAQVRALFRGRCHRNHLDTPMDANCRSYARLLDAVTRSPGAETPEDLSWHLSRCVECAEAAACLRLHGGGLPSALASGVIGWGGLAYLERRRRAADAGLLGGRRGTAVDTGIAESWAAVPRIGRTALLVTAVVVSVLALTVSLMPFDSAAEGGTTTAGGESGNRLPVVEPGTVLPSATARPSSASASPDPSESAPVSGTAPNPDTAPQGKPSSAADVTQKAAAPTKSAAPTCEVRYQIAGQWADGFQATVTVTSTKALATWGVSWTFQDGQGVTQMWDGTFLQQASRVTATAADYNKTVTAGAAFTVGFLGSWQGTNSVPDDFTLNGANCTSES
ncbi:cellulose binding domain-containing protein [Streptomyces sp. NPDC005808]|uniref:cellulose binding domain-containing protein n=1 Tax=Streptomyces sp. NPDC005808 TaxID=3364734 RepID=UPI0036B54235